MLSTLYQAFLQSKGKISTDTRNIEAGSLFFALKGDNFDGNKYAAEALNKGASMAIIDNPEFKSEQTILVEDTLIALQQLANYYRKLADFTVLALTGTNGKTTTKELINAVLSKKLKCHATAGNFNNHIGVPLTILSAPADAEILIVEMGANHQNEIGGLCEIAEPNYGLITNIGKAHLEGFGGPDGVLKAKSEMYHYLINNNRTIFYNSTDQVLKKLIGNYRNTVAYGSSSSVASVQNVAFDKGLSCTIKIGEYLAPLKTKMFGYYNLTNILTAISIGTFFNVPEVDIIEAISDYTPTNNRSQIITTKNNNTLILDSYNANPSSMSAAISSLDPTGAGNTVLILGAMKELGDASDLEHDNLVKNIITKPFYKCFLIGREFKEYNSSAIINMNNTEELIDYLRKTVIRDKVVLVKGSRSNKLEKVEPFL